MFLLFIAVSAIVEYRPDTETTIEDYSANGYDGCQPLPDTIKIMSWNIGYAGLGDNMDYFYDGGVKIRDSRERTIQNLQDIIAVMKSADADLYFLQEVDKRSHRSYYINELDSLTAHFPDYHLFYAINYKSWFVPIPLRNPIGAVDGGLVILSKYTPCRVVRMQYPSKFPFPVSLFNLKRCMLSAYFADSDGNVIMLGNTHSTAFDTGNMRSKETSFIKDLAYDFNSSGTRFIYGGDWNQYPPQYDPSKEELENEYYRPELLDTSNVSDLASVVCDFSHHTLRYNDCVYSEQSLQTLADFFIVSKGIEPLSVETMNLNYRSSDHNPVVMAVSLK